MQKEIVDQMLKQAEGLSTEEKWLIADQLLRQVKQERTVNGTHARVDSPETSDQPDTFREREQLWLRQHRQDYRGLYVALNGDHLVAYAPNLREVYKLSDEAGVKVPFIAYIEPADALPFGGW